MNRTTQIIVIGIAGAAAATLLAWNFLPPGKLAGKDDPYAVACRCGYRATMTKENMRRVANPHPEGGWAMRCPQCGGTAFVQRPDLPNHGSTPPTAPAGR